MAKKPGVVTTASGLQYVINKTGTGATPTAADQVNERPAKSAEDAALCDDDVLRFVTATSDAAIEAEQAQERLGQTQYAQPALFIIQYALAQYFLQLGR